jgi:hypothetical protein
MSGGPAAPIPGTAVGLDRYGTTANLPLRSFFTMEGKTVVRWVSLDGRRWLRYIPSEGSAPRIVLDPSYTFVGGTWLKGGKPVDPSAALEGAHWWGEGAEANGPAWGIGEPGRNHTIREAYPDGRIDTRPNDLFKERQGGYQEYDTDDPAEARSYYFTEAAAADRVKQFWLGLPGDEAEDSRHARWTAFSGDDPADAADKAALARRAKFNAPLPEAVQTEREFARALREFPAAKTKRASIGTGPTSVSGWAADLKPVPKPVLGPPSGYLGSEVRTTIAPTATLKPVILPALPTGSGKGRAPAAPKPTPKPTPKPVATPTPTFLEKKAERDKYI